MDQSNCRNPEDAVRRHRWRMLMHMDGCHHYSSTYTCLDDGCHWSLHTYDERDPAFDVWSLVWMEPTYEEAQLGDASRDRDGRDSYTFQTTSICRRCTELQDGAEPVRSMVLVP